MISAWHLLWVVPLSGVVSVALAFGVWAWVGITKAD